MNNYLIYLTAITATIFILLSSTAQADILVETSPFCPNSTSTDTYIINTNVIFNCTAPVNINVTGNNYAIFVNDSYTLDMNGTVLIGNNLGIGIQLGNNSILKNGIIRNYNKGIYLVNSINNTLINNTVNNNQDGIYFSSSSNNTLINNIAKNNRMGIYFYSSSNNTLTNNTANNNNYEGIYLYSSSSNILTNNTVNNNKYGIYLRSSNSNILTNNTVNNNNYEGIYLDSSNSNTLTNNTAQENKEYDLYVSADTDDHCNNLITNTTGSGGRPILYYNNSVTLQNQVLSELMLCNADNSNITNVTIDGSPTLKNNGLVAIRVDGSNLTGINSSNNNYGIYLDSSSSNILTNNTVNNNTDTGIYLWSSSNNTLTNNTANNNYDGIYLDSSNSNILTNNTANNNQYGIYLYSSSSNILTNNTANNNYYGIYFYSSSSNTLTNNTASNNSEIGIYLYSDSNNNTITNNIVKNNEYGGFYLDFASNNTISNNTVSNNGYDAIYLNSGSGNTITNNIVNNNEYNGFYLQSTSNNTISNNTVSNNGYDGIYLHSSSNNTITNNIVNNNSNFGISFSNSKNNTLISNTILNSIEYDFYVDINSTDNIIHNTTLNNSIISFTGKGISLKSSSPIGSIPSGYRSLGKYVNITNLSATGSWIFLNITYSDSDVVGMNESKLSIWRYDSSAWNNWTGVNGVNTSGKYVYANLTNFSIFDVFGLDDIAPSITIASPTSTTYSSSSVALSVSANEPVSAWWYSLDGGPNTTFTPNTTLSGLSNGQHTLIVYANDSVGNIGSASVEFVVNVYIPPTRRGTNLTTNITKETKTIAVIPAGASTNVTITNAATLGIKTISISVKNTVNNVQLTISKTTHPPGAAEVISPLNGKVYKYIKLTKSNIQDEDISSLTISIQVEKSWLTNNNIDEDKVALYRYDTSSNTWTKLLTTKTTSDENYVYYDAQSPGLSIFAIAGELKQAAAPQEEMPTTPEKQPTVPPETQPSMPTAPTDYTWLIIIVIIIIAGAGYYLYSQRYFGRKKRR